MDNSRFFFCYDSKLFKWLRYEKSISFLFKAKHEQTLKSFWLFERTEELTAAIDQYKQLN